MTNKERKHWVKIYNEKILENHDFERSLSYFRDFHKYHECRAHLITRSLELCIEDGDLAVKRAKKLASFLVIYGHSYSAKLVSQIFRDFNEEFILYYNSCSLIEKNNCLEAGIKTYIDSCEYVSSISDVYPILKVFGADIQDYASRKMFQLCRNEDGEINKEAEDFITTVGKKNKYAKRLLWSYFWSCLRGLFFSSALAGLGCLGITYAEKWWWLLICGCVSLSMLPTAFQYLIMLVFALINFFKSKYYYLDSTILVYHKNSNGTFSYRPPRKSKQ